MRRRVVSMSEGSRNEFREATPNVASATPSVDSASPIPPETGKSRKRTLSEMRDARRAAAVR